MIAFVMQWLVFAEWGDGLPLVFVFGVDVDDGPPPVEFEGFDELFAEVEGSALKLLFIF